MKGDKIEQKYLIQKEIEDKTNNETFIKQNKSKSSIEIHEVFSNPFDNIYVIITILKLKDTILGEELKYSKEELNLLGELREDFKEMEKQMESIDEAIKKKIGLYAKSNG